MYTFVAILLHERDPTPAVLAYWFYLYYEYLEEGRCLKVFPLWVDRWQEVTLACDWHKHSLYCLCCNGKSPRMHTANILMQEQIMRPQKICRVNRGWQKFSQCWNVVTSKWQKQTWRQSQQVKEKMQALNSQVAAGRIFFFFFYIIVVEKACG